jgi:hypothetical protein
MGAEGWWVMGYVTREDLKALGYADGTVSPADVADDMRAAAEKYKRIVNPGTTTRRMRVRVNRAFDGGEVFRGDFDACAPREMYLMRVEPAPPGAVAPAPPIAAEPTSPWRDRCSVAERRAAGLADQLQAMTDDMRRVRADRDEWREKAERGRRNA